jgi:hypothetical protein
MIIIICFNIQMDLQKMMGNCGLGSFGSEREDQWEFF